MSGLWDIQRRTDHGPRTNGQGLLPWTPSGKSGVQNNFSAKAADMH